MNFEHFFFIARKVKSCFRRHTKLLVLLAAVALLGLSHSARAGITVGMQFYKSPTFLLAFVNLNTNSITANPTNTGYFVWSHSSAMNSNLWAQLNPDGTGANQGQNYDYDSVVAEITNTWTLMITNTTSTNTYTFTLSAITSNALPQVDLVSPPDGAIGVTNRPTFSWKGGPTNYETLFVQVNDGDYSFYRNEFLDITRTNWICPTTLDYGKMYFFTVNYTTEHSGVTSSVPVDASSQPLAGWASAIQLNTFDGPYFVVTNLYAGVISSGHTNIAHYTLDDAFDLGHDSSPQNNHIYCGSGWGPGDVFTSQSVAGAGAVEFFGGSGMTPCGDAFTAWTNTIAHSFSISIWINTTNVVGNDDDDLDDNTGQSIIYADNNNHGATLGLVGHKVAFRTTDLNDNDDTLRSVQSVTTGAYVHIVATRDEFTGEKKIYINGTLDNSDIGSTQVLNAPGGDYASIGGELFSAYSGLVDDVQLYSGVLSAVEIALMTQNPGGTVPDAVNANAFNLAAYYTFDDSDPANFGLDASGNHNDFNSGGSWNFGSGPQFDSDSKSGSGAVRFDGESFLSYSPTPTNLLSALAGSFSISLWVKTTQSMGGPGDWAYDGAGIISADVPGQVNDLVPVALTDGQVAFNTGGDQDDTLHSSTRVNDGDYHHIVVTRNQFTGEKKVYIDGYLDDTGFGSTNRLDAPVTITVGAIDDASDPNPGNDPYNGFDGLVDDIQIYTGVMSAEDVQFLAQNPGATVTNRPQADSYGIALNAPALDWTSTYGVPWIVETTNTHDGISAAQSGPISGTQESRIQTQIIGPATINFWWNIINGDENNNLAFVVDGSYYYDQISGDQGYWTKDTFTVGPGPHTLTWRYYHNNSSTTEDAGLLDQVSISDQVAPTITSDIGSANIQAGSNIVLNVQYYANPAATVYWRKNGAIISGATNSTLTISNAQPSDTGYYQMFASNSVGVTQSQTAYMNVYVPTDLRPLTLSFPPVVSSSSLVPFVWTGTNTGPAGATNWYDYLYFDAPVVTPYFTVFSLGVSLVHGPALPADTYTGSNMMRFPSIPAGTYTLDLGVDYFGQIIETNESNNNLQGGTITVINPDMQPGNLQVSATNLGGTTIQFSYYLTNNGPGILDGSSFADELYISTNSVLDSSAIGIRQIDERPVLAAGQYTNITATANLPVLPSGNYYFILRVDNFGFGTVGQLWEGNETNNNLSVATRVLSSDLMPTAITSPAIASTHESIPVQWVIQNTGDGVATNANPFSGFQWDDRLYLSTNQTINPSSIYLGDFSYAYFGQEFYWYTGLPPGQTMTNFQHVTLPHVDAGNYYLVLSVDVFNTIRESNETNNSFSVPITINNPDLVPTALSAPPAANARSVFSVAWTVANQGTGTAFPVDTFASPPRQWVDRVYVSTNSTLNPAAVLLGEFSHTNALLSGTNYTTTNAVTLPGLAAGNYFLILFADGGTNIFESNEANNFRFVPITVDSPDLAATSLIITPNLSSQQPISPVYSVKNVAGVTALPGWTDRLFFSPDGVLETNNILVAEAPWTAPVPVGVSYTQLVNTAVPAVPAGDFFLLLQANGNTFFSEPNIGNNLLAQPIHVSNPDLAITNFSAPTSITITQYSQRFESDWSVVNQGAGSTYVGWSDNLYLSPTNVLDNNAVSIGGSGQNLVLGPGQPYLAFANSSLPDGIQGHYYLILDVNNSRSLYETTHTNNIAVRPIDLVVPPLPILSIVSVEVPADAWSGTDIQVSWVLTNAGNAAVDGTFNDAVYFASDAAGNNPQVVGNFQFTGHIAPGQSILRQQRISLPLSLSGTFWVEVQTDANRNVFQYSYRTNDIRIATHPLVVHLTPTPNLSLTSVLGPSNAFSSDQLTVSWIETNSGSGPTRTPNWQDGVYISSSTNLAGAAYYASLGTAGNASFLNPGDSYANSLNVTIPRGLDGTYYFVVIADVYNNVFEGTNKNDNLLASGPVQIHLTPPPDLQVTTVTPPHNAFSGQVYPIRWAVTNLGLGQTMLSENDWWDRVYVSTNNFLDYTARLVGSFEHHGGLDPTTGYSGSNVVTLPVGISGNWYFIVQSDIYNQVYEGAFEDNNSTAATFPTVVALTPPPDLEVTVMQAPATALASHALSVTYTVVNQGSTPPPNNYWTDRIYLSTNSVFDPAHSLISPDFTHYGALQPGVAYTNTISIVLPDTYTGTNYMFVYSDANSEVFELNKTNNIALASNTVVITSRPADLAVASLSAPATANAGNAFLVSWGVTNKGLGDTAVAHWSDELVLSANTLLGAPSDIILSQVSLDGLLNAGGTYSVSNQLVSVPPYVSPGSYNLFVISDYNSQVYEGTNKANNVLGPVPITITAHSADLAIVATNAPVSAISGSSVNVSWTEKNIGSLTPNSSYWLDTVYLSPDGLLGPEAILLGYSQNVSSLLPGASYSKTLPVTIPQNIQGNYYFVIVADAWDQVAEPGAEYNNVATILPPCQITPGPAADLTVTQVIIPTNAYEGQPFTLSWVVKNIGSVTASSPYWVDVAYLSVDQILDPSFDPYLGYAYHPRDLAPGESYTNTASFTIPQGLSGPYYVFVSADFGQTVFERNTRINNTADAPQAMQIQLLPPVDLVAGTITVPVNGVPGQNASITYIVSNQGSNTALGSWSDSLYISTDTNWDIGDLLFARVPHTGDIVPGASYTNTVTASLPGLVPGNYYLIVRSDILNHFSEANKSNNVAASLDSVALDVQHLTLGTPVTGTLAQGQSAFYSFDATNGQTIRIRFASTEPLSGNEIFGRLGAMPTSGQFDFAANNPFESDPVLYIPITASGRYYLLAHSAYASGTNGYTLLAEVLPFTVADIQPSYAGDKGSTTFKIRGALFDNQTIFQLVNGSNTIDSADVTLDDSSTAYVTFNMVGATNDLWSLRASMNATNPVTSVLTNAINVFAGVGAVVDVAIDGPSLVDLRFPHGMTVLYGNSGDADAVAPLILIYGNNGGSVGTRLNTLSTATIQFLGRSLQGPPNILRPQISESGQFYYFGAGALARAVTADNGETISDDDWKDIETSVRPGGLADNDWLAFWSNVRPRIGTTWGEYVQFLNGIATGFPAEQRDVRAMIGYILTNQPGFQASSSISGVLLGSASSLPQSGVDVVFYSTETNGAVTIGGTATSDSLGQFAIPRMPAGTYTCMVSNTIYDDFDMNRDGQADFNSPAFIVRNNADLPSQTIYLYEAPPLVVETNEENATLTLDSQGALHAFWFRDGKLWRAWNNLGNWVDAAPLTTNFVSGFAAAAGNKLVDGSSPGVIVVWSEGTTNSVDLYYAIGRTNAGGYRWSEPVQLTHDAVENASPSLVVGNDGKVLISYLKRGIGFADDTDVYYSVVNIASGSLLWSMSAAELATPSTTATAGQKQTFAWSKSFVSPMPDNADNNAKLNFEVAGEFGSIDCDASAKIKGTLGLEINTKDMRIWAKGTADGSFAWNVDPDLCSWAYRPDSSSANFSIELGYAQKNFVVAWLKGSKAPQMVAFGTALEVIKKELESDFSFKLEDTFEYGVRGGLKGIKWHAAPIGGFGYPTVKSAEIAGFGAVKFSAKFPNRTDEKILNMAGDTVGYVQTKEKQDSAVADRFSLSGGLEVSLKGQLYPKPKLLSLNITPTLQATIPCVLIPGGFKWTLPIPELIIDFTKDPDAVPYQSHDLDPYSGALLYDPVLQVGSTNRYGINSMSPNVESDLYDDGAPSLATDSSGISYQIWSKNGDPYDTAHIGSQLFMADFNGVNWSTPTLIPGTLGFNSQVCAITEQLGRRMAVWSHADASPLTTNTTAQEFFAIRRSADVYFALFDGTAWSAPQRVAATVGVDGDMQLGTLANGNILAVWKSTDTNHVSQILSASWNGSVWTVPQTVATGNVSAPTARQAGGVIHLLWTVALDTVNDEHFTLFESQNSGGSWSKPVAFAPTPLATPSVAAPAATPTWVQPPLLTAEGLNSLIFGAIDEKCCRCKGKTTSITNGAPTKCGIAEKSYDYKHCHKVFEYIPCGRGSGDPNDIVGPVGFGPQQWVPANQPLKYTIDFFNDPNIANAPARQVKITLPLDANFDARTFRLGDFGFSGMVFSVPLNTAFFQTRLDFTATNGYYLDVFAGVDVANHQAFWTFTTIDPLTGDLSDNVLLGFLPVDQTPPEGEAFVNFSILPLANVTTGTRVSEQATIIFDNQPPLNTPVASNMLETGAPLSNVLPLPSATLNPTFDVTWQGIGAPGGAGIGSFDIYVAQDGGSFLPWLQGTTLLQAPYIGQRGSSYAFYSIARDNSGNIQPTPAVADTSIFVSTNLPPFIPAVSNITVAPPDGTASVRIRATDPNGDQLTYTLAPGAPAGATIDLSTEIIRLPGGGSTRATNGVFRWQPGRNYAASTNAITVIVTDNGAPSLSTNVTFLIRVMDYLDVTVGSTNVEGGQTASLPVTVSSDAGVTNVVFVLQVPENILTNWSVTAVAPQITSTTLQDLITNLIISAQTAPNQSIQGTQQVVRLNFTANTNSLSGFAPIPVLSVTGNKPSGATFENYVSHDGQVAVVQDTPLIQGTLSNNVRNLALFGKTGATYQLQFTTNLQSPFAWQSLLTYGQTNGAMNMIAPTNPVIYLRLQQQ